MIAIPNEVALLYVKDLLYVKLHYNQIWDVKYRPDGKREVSHGCATIVLSEKEYRKYFHDRMTHDSMEVQEDG